VPDQPFVAVVGTGVATGVPDQCKLQIALNSMSESASDALSTCAEIASIAITAVSAVDVEQSDIRTTGLSLQDFFDQSKQRVTARIATYQLEVTIRPVEGVGAVLSALASSAGDALQVRGIQLGVEDPEPMRSEARRLAVADAMRKASELTHAAGIRLGSIIAMTDGHAGPWNSGVRTMALSAASSGAAMPIEAGEVSSVSSVTITYAIEA
jgi:uncharacterized protein YggE